MLLVSKLMNPVREVIFVPPNFTFLFLAFTSIALRIRCAAYPMKPPRGDAAMLVHVVGHVLDVADEHPHLLADVHGIREQIALILGIIRAVH